MMLYIIVTYITHIDKCVLVIKMHQIEHGGGLCNDFQVLLINLTCDELIMKIYEIYSFIGSYILHTNIMH
jgi:hypothetical protein